MAKNVPPFCAARVLDAGLDGVTAFLVSEYIAGRSLLELVSAEGVRRGHDLEAVAIGMATGLASVHQAGLVHGSFGPEFVIMAADGSPRVVEFGITPPYGTATPSADMVAWARTVVFAASGRAPTTRADLDVLPGHLRGPVEQCLDPRSAGTLSARTAVRSLLGNQDLPAGLLAEGSRRATRPGRGGYDRVSSSVHQPGQAHARPTVEPPSRTPTPASPAAPTQEASRSAAGCGRQPDRAPHWTCRHWTCRHWTCRHWTCRHTVARSIGPSRALAPRLRTPHRLRRRLCSPIVGSCRPVTPRRVGRTLGSLVIGSPAVWSRCNGSLRTGSRWLGTRRAGSRAGPPSRSGHVRVAALRGQPAGAPRPRWEAAQAASRLARRRRRHDRGCRGLATRPGRRRPRQ